MVYFARTLNLTSTSSVVKRYSIKFNIRPTNLAVVDAYIAFVINWGNG